MLYAKMDELKKEQALQWWYSDKWTETKTHAASSIFINPWR
jgi:hypothetical protein